MSLQAPFPWFGGKRRVAPEVWERFGDVANYVEPFAGSLAVLLGRPSDHVAKVETINDLDGFIANFWRAVGHDPESVAAYADWPVIEADLNARHAWLVGQRANLTARLEGDPDFYDSKIAGWWVAGVCGWIGSGYCSGEGPWRVIDGELVLGNAGQGINKQLPHLSNVGQGINKQLPHLSNVGQGINKKLPHLGDVGRGAFIQQWFEQLAARMRDVRVCSGDWQRVVSESVTVRNGVTGVFLDPPYGAEVEQTRVYATDAPDVSAEVRQWCVEHGNNARLRIALCGYEGEGHELLLDHGWTVQAWRAAGGYGGGRGGTGEANRHKERIYFSPGCLAPEHDLLALLDGAK